MIELSRIRTDGETQARVELNDAVVADYADLYRAGVQMPPVTLFYDGSNFWLADGYHRFHGARAAGLTEIAEDITPGTKRDALRYSLGANGQHGLHRTTADKRRAVETAMQDPEWGLMSDRKLAELCSVSVSFVGATRRPEVAQKQAANRVEHAKTTAEKCSPTTPPLQAVAPPSVDTLIDYVINRVGAAPTISPETGAVAATLTEPADGTVEPEAPPEYSELDQAHDLIAELQAALAVASMGDVPEEEKSQAADLIADLRAELKTARAELDAVKFSRDSLMAENAQMKRQMAQQRRDIEKLKRGVARG